MSKPAADPPIDPCSLVQLWSGMATEFGESNPHAAKALQHCADQLAAWIHHEGLSVILCMPPAFLRLIQAAHNYDPNDQERVDDLQELCQAACALQNGPS